MAQNGNKGAVLPAESPQRGGNIMTISFLKIDKAIVWTVTKGR